MLNVNDDEFLWSQKYRPKSLDDCVLPPDMRAELKGFVGKGDVINLLMYGAAGVGKTSVAKALMNDLNADFIFINCSKDRNIDTLRNQISEYASSISFGGGRKFVILDEADGLSTITQPALKAFMEEVSSNCGFILTANHVNKIIPPLRSRCLEMPFVFNKDDRMGLMKGSIIRILEILKNEKIPVDTEAKQIVAALVKRGYPDIRNILNLLQRYTVSGKLDTGILTKYSEMQISSLLDFMKAKNFKEVRTWVGENSDMDISTLIGELYRDLSPKLMPQTTPAMILILNKYDYQAAFVSNRELNIMAMLTELMSEVSFL